MNSELQTGADPLIPDLGLHRLPGQLSLTADHPGAGSWAVVGAVLNAAFFAVMNSLSDFPG